MFSVSWYYRKLQPTHLYYLSSVCGAFHNKKLTPTHTKNTETPICIFHVFDLFLQSALLMHNLFAFIQMAGADPKWQKDAADQNFDYMFKLLIIGNSSVGKTSFLFRYADDSFTSAFVSTVGIDFKVKTVFRHDKRVKLQIWVHGESE